MQLYNKLIIKRNINRRNNNNYIEFMQTEKNLCNSVLQIIKFYVIIMIKIILGFPGGNNWV